MGEKGVLPQSRVFFHTPSQFAQEALYYLANAGSYVCSNLYETKRDWYDHYLFVYIKKGKMEIHYQNHEFIATDDSFIFLDCHKPHLYRALENTTFDWCHFSGNASKEYYQRLFHKQGCVFPLNNQWEIPNYLRQILLMMENNKVNEQEISIVIHKILYELDHISTTANGLLEETIKQAVQYMENHHGDEINLADIANHVRLSPFHFSRIFKRHTNSTPHQYLISYRVNNAKKLLYNTNLSIKEIAFTCGFNSVSHFVTTFKKQTNLTPKKFRSLRF